MNHVFAQVIALTFMMSTASAQVVFSDDSFSGWESRERVFGPVGASSGENFLEGNPTNCYLATVNQSGVLVAGESEVSAWAGGQLFDPGGVHEIRNIKFDMDLRGIYRSGFATQLHAYPLIRQDGKNYIDASQVITPFFSNRWQRETLLTIPDASSFSKVTFGTIYSNQHPDFGTSGSPLGFGYYLTSESSFPFHYDLFLDNFLVTFDVELPRIDLFQSIMQRGQPTTLTLERAQPEELVFFMVGKNGLGQGPCFPHFGGLCLGILDPVKLLGVAEADEHGVATFSGLVPQSAPLISVYTQAMIRRGVGGMDSLASNTVSAVILP